MAIKSTPIILCLCLLWVCSLQTGCVKGYKQGNTYPKLEFPPDAKIMTVLGPIPLDSLGRTLPHEHILVDFIGAKQVHPGRYNQDSVIGRVKPFLIQIKEMGFDALFECTPSYLGKDVELLRSLSRETDLNIISNTGYYGTRKGFFLPDHAFEESAEQLAQRWIEEFNNGIGKTEIKPGFIKISVNPITFTDVDRKLVQAAALTHHETGLTIGSHTTSGPSVLQIIDILEEMDVPLSSFIWIHAQTVADTSYHEEVVKRGAWIEFDHVSDKKESLNSHLSWIMKMKSWGRLNQVLISHDAGWYHVGEPNGGEFRPFTSIHQKFIPLLKANGFTDQTIDTLLIYNPAIAFAYN